MSNCDFERILLEAIDESLSSLGQSSKQAVYFHLEQSFNIKKHEIPYKINAFAEAIERIFGVGAKFLEILIMKQLHKKIGGIIKLHEYANLAFTEYITAAKRSFLEKNKAKKFLKETIDCGRIKLEI